VAILQIMTISPQQKVKALAKVDSLFLICKNPKMKKKERKKERKTKYKSKYVPRVKIETTNG
jgi:hypothetical protein